MKALLKRLVRLLMREDGPTAVEYAMMVLLVLLACLSAITLVGQSMSRSVQDSNDSIQEALDSSA